MGFYGPSTSSLITFYLLYMVETLSVHFLYLTTDTSKKLSVQNCLWASELLLMEPSLSRAVDGLCGHWLARWQLLSEIKHCDLVNRGGWVARPHLHRVHAWYCTTRNTTTSSGLPILSLDCSHVRVGTSQGPGQHLRTWYICPTVPCYHVYVYVVAADGAGRRVDPRIKYRSRA